MLMIKFPFVFGANHLSLDEWQEDLKEVANDYEKYICGILKYPTREQARRLINLRYLIEALPTILKSE